VASKGSVGLPVLSKKIKQLQPLDALEIAADDLRADDYYNVEIMQCYNTYPMSGLTVIDL